jgi:hypothetical protein
MQVGRRTLERTRFCAQDGLATAKGQPEGCRMPANLTRTPLSAAVPRLPSLNMPPLVDRYPRYSTDREAAEENKLEG